LQRPRRELRPLRGGDRARGRAGGRRDRGRRRPRRQDGRGPGRGRQRGPGPRRDRRGRLRRGDLSRVELPIEGMTCATCASRIERRLNKLDGVTATVNYATEKAAVEYDAGAVEPEHLIEPVE